MKTINAEVKIIPNYGYIGIYNFPLDINNFGCMGVFLTEKECAIKLEELNKTLYKDILCCKAVIKFELPAFTKETK